MTFRRVRVLIDHLPSESATKTELRDSLSSQEWDDLPRPDGWGPWSHTDHLLAKIADQLSWVMYTVSASAGGKPQEPIPMERPGVGKPPWETEVERSRSKARAMYLVTHQGAAPPDDWNPDE